jgi:hypothetical protein
MRLYVFAIGGTGARVLHSLTMLLASGVELTDEGGKKYELVPIIIDPDMQNGNVSNTEGLLQLYCNIQQDLDGVTESRSSGFFNTKITSLNQIANKGQQQVQNNFLYGFAGDSQMSFRDFINYNSLGQDFQAFLQTIYSYRNLNDTMAVGFKGNPNVGSVFLNNFQNSVEYQTFLSTFQAADDRVFVIGSLFGGTGAAGMPLIVKTIRDDKKPTINGALIGALAVMPYFNIQKPQGQSVDIDSSSFITKTKAALTYYHNNFNEPDAIFYIGDQSASNPYNYSIGAAGQKNDAHFIELAGALAILQYGRMAKATLAPPTRSNQNPSVCLEFGIENDSLQLNLNDLGVPKRDIAKFLTSFYLYNFLHPTIKNSESAWRKTIGLDSTHTGSIESFFTFFKEWLTQLGNNRRAFIPFNLSESRLTHIVAGNEVKDGWFSKFDSKYIETELNGQSKNVKQTTTFQKYAHLVYTTFVKVCEDKFKFN